MEEEGDFLGFLTFIFLQYVHHQDVPPVSVDNQPPLPLQWGEPFTFVCSIYGQHDHETMSAGWTSLVVMLSMRFESDSRYILAPCHGLSSFLDPNLSMAHGVRVTLEDHNLWAYISSSSSWKDLSSNLSDLFSYHPLRPSSFVGSSVYLLFLPWTSINPWFSS